MQIVRFIRPGADGPEVGVGSNGTITPLTGIDSIGALLREPLDRIRERLAASGAAAHAAVHAAADVTLLPPVDAATEVWAAGVTYRQSREARVQESDRSATVYEQVYEADRPELFFKSTAWRVVGDGEPIAVREDSTVDVPEPELALVLNAAGETVGYTIGDDVSSRSIEGENPLYLPQAKIYLGGCAIGPGIRPAWEIADPCRLGIRLRITRDGAPAWSGETNTDQIHRSLDDLAAWLYRADAFPDGAVLSTGTCLVPDLPFTLREGDEVRIEIDGLGALTNPVVRGRAAMRWLVDARPIRT